jgi:hypothetical protein
MNEINLNSLSRAAGVDKNFSAGAQKNVQRNVDDQDSVQLSSIPDLSAIEAAIENEFASRRASLEEEARAENYPPLETIDRLAAMFALNLEPSIDKKKAP